MLRFDEFFEFANELLVIKLLKTRFFLTHKMQIREKRPKFTEIMLKNHANKNQLFIFFTVPIIKITHSI